MRAELMANLSGRLQRIPIREVFSIGRSAECDLVLEHGFVSQKHCTLLIDRGGVSIVDHDSSNGTVVNGAVVRGKASLASGDVIEVGPYVLTLVLRKDEPTGQTAPPPPPPQIRRAPSTRPSPLGAQMQTLTEARPQVRTLIEVVDAPKPRGTTVRLSFRDAVTTKIATTVIAGDLEPHADAGKVLADVRHHLRELAHAGATPAALASGLSTLLERHGARATAVLARVEPTSRLLVYANAHAGEPMLLRAGERTLQRLDGDRRDVSLGITSAAPLTEQSTTLQPGDVLILASAGMANLLKLLWDIEPPYLGKDRRASSVGMWLSNQASRNPPDWSCAVCCEIVTGGS